MIYQGFWSNSLIITLAMNEKEVYRFEAPNLILVDKLNKIIMETKRLDENTKIKLEGPLK